MLTSDGTLILNLGPRPLKISHIGILSENFITNNEQYYNKIWIWDISGFFLDASTSGNMVIIF